MRDLKGKIQVELQDWMGDDAAIANAAWTSTYDKERREDKYDDPQKVEDIVRRLAKDGHGVPFESVVFRFWIRMPIMTDRQHMTHRIASHNGLSGRYRTVPEDWFPVPQDVRDIMDSARGLGAGSQVSSQFDELCEAPNKWYRDRLKELKEAEKAGRITNAQFKRAREVLRGAIPVAGMIERTTLINLRSFANLMRQRVSSHAQREICQEVSLMYQAVKAQNICPVALDALAKKGWLLEEPNYQWEQYLILDDE